MKRFIHRAKEGISEKFGKSERTIDDEYDNLYRRFEQITTASVNYQKHVQQFVENFHSMTTTMTFIAEDMTDLFKNQNSREQEVARKLMDAAQECETNAVKPFQEQIVSSVVAPLNAYIEKFDVAKKLHKERMQHLQEYDYYRTKVKNLMEKQNKDPMKLPQNKDKMNKKKEELDNIQFEASSKMTEIVNEQPIVFAPLTNTTIASLLQYSNKVFSTLNGISILQDPSGQASNMGTVNQYANVELSYKAPARPQPSAPRVQPRSNSLHKTEPVPPKFNVEWYYLDSEMQQKGPLNFNNLKSKYRTKELNEQTFVFGAAEQSDWKTIGDYSELKRVLSDIATS